jgi:hypothetical protein
MPIPRYGRWMHEFDPAAQVERVEFVAPDGSVEVRSTFRHQPAELRYDHHGYETVVAVGDPLTAVRFTPTQTGIYSYRALCGDTCVAEGSLQCEPSVHPGYVEVSRRDPRYFACSDGSSYCAIGPCLVGPPQYQLPKGMEHFATGEAQATLGCHEYRRWFRLLARHGANYCRLWLSNAFFNVETETAGELNLAAFARLDTVIELARQYGIRLKLCIEHFRTFEPGTPFYKMLKHPFDGRSPASIDEWLQEPTWRELWLSKVKAYIARYGGDPTVMAWELWNEMDCVKTSRWELVRDWTRDMLVEIKCLVPRQLVVNSLGSFDDLRKQRIQDDFHMPEMDFQQVHRYLDQGAPWEICTLDPVAFSIDAIQQARRPDRPIILAETGAVNDRHTGPFRYYRMDERGIILHDTTYPAFFAGAAGTGHIWHWDQYVDQKDLWNQYGPFAHLVAGVALDAEAFQPVDLSTDRVWFLALRGTQHLLAWIRNKADSWHAVLRDEVEPAVLDNLVFDLTSLGVRAGQVQVYSAWPEDAVDARLEDGRLHVPSLHYGLMTKVRLA